MAELEYGNRDNLFNMQKTIGPDGAIMDMTVNLAEKNDLVRDLPSFPANNNLSHTGVRWITLPTGAVVSIGGGWSAEMGVLQNFEEGMFIYKARHQIPEDVLNAELPENRERYMDGMHKGFVEGMSQGWANTLMRGTAATAPEKIDGLQNRAPWNSLSNTDYVWDMGGSSNLRSAWLMWPGITTVHLIHPKSHPTLGIGKEDKGSTYVAASVTDSQATGYRWDLITEFDFWQGICVRHQPAVKRICNIDSALSSMDTTLVSLITEARLKHQITGNPMLYCDAAIYTQLVLMADAKVNVIYSVDNPYRMRLPMIGDITIRRMDALNVDESAVTS